MVARRGVKKADKEKKGNKIKKTPHVLRTEIHVQLHHSCRRNCHLLGHSMPLTLYLPLSEARRSVINLPLEHYSPGRQ